MGPQNVLVSCKPGKSNLVLSGSATISWLFVPSGPYSSDLWWRILSRDLGAMWRRRGESFFQVLSDIISTERSQTVLRREYIVFEVKLTCYGQR